MQDPTIIDSIIRYYVFKKTNKPPESSTFNYSLSRFENKDLEITEWSHIDGLPKPGVEDLKTINIQEAINYMNLERRLASVTYLPTFTTGQIERFANSVGGNMTLIYNSTTGDIEAVDKTRRFKVLTAPLP